MAVETPLTYRLSKDVINISESLQKRAYKGLKEEELVTLMKVRTPYLQENQMAPCLGFELEKPPI